jgi:ethanolamine ammonia-lyase small subunit
MQEGMIRDIAAIEYNGRLTIDKPKDADSCVRLKKTTNARICVGRAGDRIKTETWLRFRADHAVAMDAVWSDVDESVIDQLKFYKIQTLAKDKEQYLTRPDLGRKFSEQTLGEVKKHCVMNPVVQILVADGLSSPAINANLADIYPMIVDGVRANGHQLGTPIFIKYGRVATMDQLSEALGACVTVLLVGERPGLATGESMSCYMAYESSTAKPESQRNVISNIHRNGIPPVEAGAQIVQLIDILLREKNSGVTLKL